jgi:dienelactone hydrolase
MKTSCGLWAALLALAAGPAAGQEGDEARLAGLKESARGFVELLAKEDFPAAGKNFDEAMRKALPTDKLQAMWKTLTGQAGALKKQWAMRTERRGKYDIVLVRCEFAKMALDARVVFNRDNQITGLNFVPPPVPYTAPAYVRKDAFRETEVTVGSGDWALPGTLTLPLGDGPFPAVVLVHGSGPHDRDETLGPNKPFRDLAWGLASRGVAVLRYEKRTRHHSAKLTSSKEPLTIKEEVLDDALAAAALLRKTRPVNPDKVFVLGHSLGAMFAPRLGALDPGLAGLVCLAGSTRPLEDVIVEQLDYILSLDGGPPEEQKKELEKIKKQVARLKDPKLDRDVPASELPFGVSAAYWLSLRGYRPAEVAAGLKRPMLILQGGRDYQVTMEDFKGWQQALASRKDVTLKAYPDLNHLFMEGKGKARPAEYQKAGHVAAAVVEDVAGWVKGH